MFASVEYTHKYTCIYTYTHTHTHHTLSASAAFASICATSAFVDKTRKTGTWPLALDQMGGTEVCTSQSDAIWRLRGVAKGAGRAISLRIFRERISVRDPMAGEEGPDRPSDLGSVGVTRGCSDSK